MKNDTNPIVTPAPVQEEEAQKTGINWWKVALYGAATAGLISLGYALANKDDEESDEDGASEETTTE